MNPSESLSEAGLGAPTKRRAIDYLQYMRGFVAGDGHPDGMLRTDITAHLALGFVAGLRLGEVRETGLSLSTEQAIEEFFHHNTEYNTEVQQGRRTGEAMTPQDMVREYGNRVADNGDLLEAIEDAIGLLAADLGDDDGERT